MKSIRQFEKISGDSFTAQCASCGMSHDSSEMYFDSDKDSRMYKAHYCSPCACMLKIASQDAKDKRNAARRARHQAYIDCGLKRVRGALGGIYYE